MSWKEFKPRGCSRWASPLGIAPMPQGTRRGRGGTRPKHERSPAHHAHPPIVPEAPVAQRLQAGHFPAASATRVARGSLARGGEAGDSDGRPGARLEGPPLRLLPCLQATAAWRSGCAAAVASSPPAEARGCTPAPRSLSERAWLLASFVRHASAGSISKCLALHLKRHHAKTRPAKTFPRRTFPI